MNISIFGLGYVGCVSAACLANEGYKIIGVDINQEKISMINQGKSPIIEKDIDNLIKTAISKNKLMATTDHFKAVMETEVSLICVGTPSDINGKLNLNYIKRCIKNIARALKEKKDYHVIVIRSTVLPGTTENIIIKEIEKYSKKKVGNDFGVVMNPEFLREGSSVYDFYNPLFTIIGEYDKKSGEIVEKLYNFLSAPVIHTDIKTAEMLKYACNAFHALKITFANEIGNLCKKLKIDSHKVMEIFCMDTKLNISSAYLKPGFAFGGSCLPKDLKALTYKAKELDIEVPVLKSILESNRLQIQSVLNKILISKKKKIGILGLSFKPGTDDLRESPMVTLVESLLGKGYKIKIYDNNVFLSRLIGANKEYIEKEIPHISSLMCNSLEEVINFAEIIVIGHNNSEFKRIFELCNNSHLIFDLVRIVKDLSNVPKGYEGICW